MISSNASKQINEQPPLIKELEVTNDSIFREKKRFYLGDTTRGKVKSKLLDDFHPGPYSVIIGRGKTALNAVGNRRLHVIASTFLEKYSQANTRLQKTAIVSQIVDIFEEACPVGAFVKFSDRCWWEVSDTIVREKVGHVLRDMLHAKYRSSSKSKTARRRKLREEARSVSMTSLELNSTRHSSPLDKEQQKDTQQKQSSSTKASCVTGEEITLKHNNVNTQQTLSIKAHEEITLNYMNTQQTLSLKKRPASCPSFGGGYKYTNREPRMAVMDKAISKLLDETFLGHDPKIEPQCFRNRNHSLSDDESIMKLGHQPDLRKLLSLDDLNAMTILRNNGQSFAALNTDDDDIFNVFDDEHDGVSPTIFD